MQTRFRTLILALAATGGFAATTIAPAVSQADSKTKGKEVTCAGGAKAGDIKTFTISINGKVTSSVSEICGSDGKWHEEAKLEISKELKSLLGSRGFRQSITVLPSGALRTVTRISRSAVMRLGASALTPAITSTSQARLAGGRPSLGALHLGKTAVDLEARSNLREGSDTDAECEKAATSYNEYTSKAHKAAESGNVADFTEYFQFAVTELQGLKVAGCKVTSA